MTEAVALILNIALGIGILALLFHVMLAPFRLDDAPCPRKQAAASRYRGSRSRTSSAYQASTQIRTASGIAHVRTPWAAVEAARLRCGANWLPPCR